MSLPPRAAAWLASAGVPSSGTGSLPAEGRASCDACPQCPNGPAELPRALATFDPRSKCCTYLPLLRNFQVGAILADPDPGLGLGQASVRARVAARRAVTPLGLLWPTSYTQAYDEDNERDFGRRQDLRCPHYIEQGGLCGVWRHRNATCSTWFCRYERGAVGRRLWQQVHRTLEVIEDVLMWWAVDAVGLEPAVREALACGSPTVRLEEGPLDDEAVAACWGARAAEQEAWYIACHRAVEALRWPDIRRIGGGRLTEAIDELHEALEDHENRKLPPFLAAGDLSVALEEGGVSWVYGYRAYDAVPVPSGALASARALGPVPTAQMAGALSVDDAALRRLIDLGVLKAQLPG